MKTYLITQTTKQGQSFTHVLEAKNQLEALKMLFDSFNDIYKLTIKQLQNA